MRVNSAQTCITLTTVWFVSIESKLGKIEEDP